MVKAEQQLTQVRPRLDPVTLGAGEDGEQDGRSRSGFLVALGTSADRESQHAARPSSRQPASRTQSRHRAKSRAQRALSLRPARYKHHTTKPVSITPSPHNETTTTSRIPTCGSVASRSSNAAPKIQPAARPCRRGVPAKFPGRIWSMRALPWTRLPDDLAPTILAAVIEVLSTSNRECGNEVDPQSRPHLRRSVRDSRQARDSKNAFNNTDQAGALKRGDDCERAARQRSGRVAAAGLFRTAWRAAATSDGSPVIHGGGSKTSIVKQSAVTAGWFQKTRYSALRTREGPAHGVKVEELTTV